MFSMFFQWSPLVSLCAKHLKASKTIQNHFVDSARLQVSDPQTKHRLNEFQAEFSLWASHDQFQHICSTHILEGRQHEFLVDSIKALLEGHQAKGRGRVQHV